MSRLAKPATIQIKDAACAICFDAAEHKGESLTIESAGALLTFAPFEIKAIRFGLESKKK